MTLTLGALNVLHGILSAPSLFTTTGDMFVAGRLLTVVIGDNSYRGNDQAELMVHIQKAKEVQFGEIETALIKKTISTAIEKGLLGCSPPLFELLTAFDIKE